MYSEVWRIEMTGFPGFALKQNRGEKKKKKRDKANG